MFQTIANGAPDARCPGQTRTMLKFRLPDDLFHTCWTSFHHDHGWDSRVLLFFSPSGVKVAETNQDMLPFRHSFAFGHSPLTPSTLSPPSLNNTDTPIYVFPLDLVLSTIINRRKREKREGTSKTIEKIIKQFWGLSLT